MAIAARTRASGEPRVADRPEVVDTRRMVALLCGIGFVVFFVVGTFLDNTPNPNASNLDWTRWFASSGHQIEVVVSGFLLVFAALCLIGFFVSAWSRLTDLRRPRRTSPMPVVAAGVASAGIAVGAVLGAAVAGAMIFGQMPEPGPQLLRVSDQFGYPVVLVAGMLATALAMTGLALQARRAGLFGAGLTIFSLVVAVVTLFSFVFFPVFVTMIWFLVVSVALWRRPERQGQPQQVSSEAA